MKKNHDLNTYSSENSSVVTIGTFDGVHIGHKKIIQKLVENSRVNGLKSVLLTFFPHPRMVLQKESNLKLINTIDEKIAILETLGLDQLVIHPFDKEFSRLTALEFVRDILVNTLKTKKIIIGYDHRFGRNRNANIKDLIEYGSTFDFEVEEITAQEINDVSVSSTKIRRALEEGNIEKANSYLGYEFMLTGRVVRGKALGRTLNFPTANLHIEENYKLIPKEGAYVVKSTIEETDYFGMMNIGNNPTVDGKQQSIEVHFFDFDRDLYDQKVQVSLLKHLRDEQKFDSIDALKKQLEEDKNNALHYISVYNAKPPSI